MDYTSGNTIVPTSLSEEPKESTTQPQKQGYFTSILSSLPNLSLSAIKGESNKPQEYHEPQQAQYVDPSLQNPYGPPPGPPTFLATNPYDSRLQTPTSPFESSPAPPQQVPPPTTLPPSGGEFFCLVIPLSEFFSMKKLSLLFYLFFSDRLLSTWQSKASEIRTTSGFDF